MRQTPQRLTGKPVAPLHVLTITVGTKQLWAAIAPFLA